MPTEAPPPQPKSILRGHKTQVHAASFIRQNDRLITGDADGFVILWDLAIMRPRAVWQAHTNAILGVAGWGMDKVITHGRDNKLIVWRLTTEDEAGLSTTLPLEPIATPRPKPWMLHLLEVNTMNFCAFSACAPEPGLEEPSEELLIAVPNTLASEAVDVFHLPSQNRLHTVKLGEKNGMVMALSIFHKESFLTIAAGYENGLATVARLEEDGNWVVTYRTRCHSQAILSLHVAASMDYFLTSGADAVVAKHPIPPQHSGLDEDAAPDQRVLHHSPAPAADAAAAVAMTAHTESTRMDQVARKPVSLLSAALAGQSATVSLHKASRTKLEVQTQPMRVVNTKHAGQQDLKIRSDDRIFATAGWDSKVRIYSTKTLREVAVLKWHQVGGYAVAFSSLDSSRPGQDEVPVGETTPTEACEPSGQLSQSKLTVVPKLVEVSVKDKRIRHAETAHWLAAGSKDGKVSIWDVF